MPQDLDYQTTSFSYETLELGSWLIDISNQGLGNVVISVTPLNPKVHPILFSSIAREIARKLGAVYSASFSQRLEASMKLWSPLELSKQQWLSWPISPSSKQRLKDSTPICRLEWTLKGFKSVGTSESSTKTESSSQSSSTKPMEPDTSPSGSTTTPKPETNGTVSASPTPKQW